MDTSSFIRSLKKYLKKRPLKSLIILFFITGIIYIMYQIFFLGGIEELYKIEEIKEKRIIDVLKLKNLSETGYFMCFPSRIKIPLAYLNDDYCDCPDGSDETKTNACSNGVMHCQKNRNERVKIPSSRINDGICDCCDGADEWKRIESPIKQSIEIQRKTGIFLSPCINRCIIY